METNIENFSISIAALLAFVGLILFYRSHANKRRITLYKRFFSDIYEIGKYEWLVQRADDIEKYGVNRLAYRELDVNIEISGSNIYYQERNGFGDYYKVSTAEAFRLFKKKERMDDIDLID